MSSAFQVDGLLIKISKKIAVLLMPKFNTVDKAFCNYARCFFILMQLSLLFWKYYKHNRAVIRAFFNFYCTLVEHHNFPNKR